MSFYFYLIICTLHVYNESIRVTRVKLNGCAHMANEADSDSEYIINKTLCAIVHLLVQSLSFFLSQTHTHAHIRTHTLETYCLALTASGGFTHVSSLGRRSAEWRS